MSSKVESDKRVCSSVEGTVDDCETNKLSNGISGANFGLNSDCDDDGMDLSSSIRSRPFERSANIATKQEYAERIKQYITRILVKLSEEIPRNEDVNDLLQESTRIILNRWRAREELSEIAFQGLLFILEYCLTFTMEHFTLFDYFISTLGYHTVSFWRNAIPFVYDSDLSHGTHYRDSLLFSLALYDVNNSKNRLTELYAAVPGLRHSMLGIRAKRFGEKFRHLQMVKSRASSRMSSRICSAENLLELVNDVCPDDSADATSDDHVSGGLTDTTHHKQRVINVSNAPPVSLKRKDSGCWEIHQGSGGLVSCVDPVMSVDKENVWLANIGIHWQNVSEREEELDTDIVPPSTNSLGLPLLKQAKAGEIFHVLSDDPKTPDMSETERNIENDMSLLSVLQNYNKDNYQLTPVFVDPNDYNTYYGGISNGLLWPALHNLPEFICKDYDDLLTLREHWCTYVRVNYSFAINAVRNGRPQDFVWIHDYHLMLTGQLMRSLDNTLEVGFFLHIPFQPPDDWFTKYRIVAEPILRSILRFTKVGFQTIRDRQRYVDLVKKHIARARVIYESSIDVYTITHEGYTCSLGVFPVSIKNEDFLSIARSSDVQAEAEEFRKEVLSRGSSQGCFFFSVERFDYTKGIIEKLEAWERYLQKNPERIGMDVLFQVAVINRRSVQEYSTYQDKCLSLADKINETYRSKQYPEWRPIRFEKEGLPRAKLIAHYLAMDVGVVSPIKDGMNLVAKEMLICNPRAALILSSGAGTEAQLGAAGFYGQERQCYFRVDDITDTETFADIFYQAATETREDREEHGLCLKQYLMNHDIDEWSAAFLDSSWNCEVIRLTEIKLLADFYQIMDKTCQIRRQITECVLKGIPIRPQFGVSLENAKNSLENSCSSGTHTLVLETSTGGEDSDGNSPAATVKFDVSNELEELKRDIAFLQFIQSDEITNVEQFVATLGQFHPSGPDAFSEEVEKAFNLLSEGDHFHYLFTDRDGTLKSYSCSYPASIQPAYSAVIQAQFARRCAQFCAIVTTAPLMHIGILNVNTIPEGYYAYGASVGREWYMNPAMQFKDNTVNEADLALLNNVFEKIEELLEEPTYRNFTWIGSGLQRHFGHITIARQDVNHSISKQKSALLFQAVSKIVNEVDPIGSTLTLREGEFDLKIFTKAKLSGRIFNKGHGIQLIQRKMGLKMNEGHILVCGDSETDIPMLEECLRRSPKNVFTIWVTSNPKLQEKVCATMKSYDNDYYVFVSCPEVLLGAMASATVREIRIRPRVESDDEEC